MSDEIERLERVWREAVERGADLYMEDLATLLASHNKLVEGLRRIADSKPATQETSLAHEMADDAAALLKELGQ